MAIAVACAALFYRLLAPMVDIIFGFPFEMDEDEDATFSLVKDVVDSAKCMSITRCRCQKHRLP